MEIEFSHFTLQMLRHIKTSDFSSLSTNKKTSDTFERHPICRQFFLKTHLIVYFQDSMFYRILIAVSSTLKHTQTAIDGDQSCVQILLCYKIH